MDTHKYVWLDHRKAYIISFNSKGEDVTIVRSEANTRERYSGESPQGSRFGGQPVQHEKAKEERLKHQFSHYYQSIIDEVKDATGIHLMGPAEAKTELSKAIAANPLFKGKPITIETTDQLTENQLKAKARELHN